MRNGHTSTRANPAGLLQRTTLSLMIAAALGASTASAQDPATADKPKPGLYTSVDEASIYIIQPDGTQTDVMTGESVKLTDDGVEFIAQRPQFLNWPCGTSFAPNRGTLTTFTFDSLPAGDQIAEVANRYFNNQQVLDTQPNWLNGEFNGVLSADQIDQFVSNAYWYKTGPAPAKMANFRPKTLLISLFYGTGQVVVDTNHLDSLKAHYGDEPIPTVFIYQEENVVPISYFGERPQPWQIVKASNESGIRPADVPLWYAGDAHTSENPEQLAIVTNVPPASEMDPESLARIREDIAKNGMSAKPITLGMVAGSEEILVDSPERLRAAQMAGLATVPVMYSVYENDMIASECGVQPPVEAVGVLGTTEGEAPGYIPPDETDQPGLPDQPTQPPDGPGRPTPPEIVPPNPPPPELPVSDN